MSTKFKSAENFCICVYIRICFLREGNVSLNCSTGGIRILKCKSIMLSCRHYNVEEMLNRFDAEGTRRAGSYDGNTGPSVAPLATRIECDTSTSDTVDSFGDVTARHGTMLQSCNLSITSLAIRDIFERLA